MMYSSCDHGWQGKAMNSRSSFIEEVWTWLRQLPRQGVKHGISSVVVRILEARLTPPGKLSLYSRINRGNPAQAGSIRAWIRSQSERVEPPSKWVSRRDCRGPERGCGELPKA